MEEWKCIDDCYEVSNLGRVRRTRSGHGTWAGRILKPQNAKGGYYKLTLHGKFTPSIHSLVAKAFIGPRPLNKEVNHKNGDKRDNRVVNLEYVTNEEQERHAYKLGLKKPRISSEIAYRIIKEYRLRCSGHGPHSLGKKFGVSHQTVQDLVKGRRRWFNIESSTK